MEVKKLYEMVDEDQKEGSLGEKAYWKDLWECYIEEKSMDYASLSVKEAIPRLVSEQNLRERRHAGSCGELGVDIRVGDICYIDFGEAYIAGEAYELYKVGKEKIHKKFLAENPEYLERVEELRKKASKKR